MARILAIDWDEVEARFAFANVLKDRLVVLKAGSAPIVDAASAVAKTEAAIDGGEDGEIVETPADEGESDESDGGEVETVETVGRPRAPVTDDDEEDEDGEVETVETVGRPRAPVTDDEDDEDEDGTVVVKTKKVETYKKSPLATTLKNLLRENRVGSATVCVSVERGDVEVLRLTVPQASEAETPEIVRNQMSRDSLTFDETQPLDYLPLGTPSKKGTRSVAAVSIARDKARKIRETLVGAGRAPSKIELREPALAEFLRADFCGLNYDEPVALIQELCDEIQLTLCDSGVVLFFRSFKVGKDATPRERAERIRQELKRTVAVGFDDLPEDAVLQRAVFFSGEENVDQYDPLTPSVLQTQLEPTDADLEGKSTERILSILLRADQIGLQFVDPFRLPGIELKTTEPETPGRFASLIGVALAERPQNKPAIDLLHPREKPKPPNYALCASLFLTIAAIAFGGVWYWNRGELKKLGDEVAKLEKERAEVAQGWQIARNPYSILSSVNAWENAEGVVALDELRDIANRIPKAPDLVVTRLSYLANFNGRPTFVIEAKITTVDVYRQFRESLMRDGSHAVLSRRGAVANVGGGGYKYMFEANIVCKRRPYGNYLAILPADVRAISNQTPEYLAELEKQRQEEERKKAEELRKAQEEAARKAAEEAAKRAEEERKAQEELARKAEEERKAQEDAARQAAEEAAKQAAEAEQNAPSEQTPQNGEGAQPAQEGQNAQPAQDGNQAQNGQNVQPQRTPEQIQLLQYRARLDNNMRQAQYNFQQGRIDRQKLQQIQAAYQAEVTKVVARWNQTIQEQQRQAAQAAQSAEQPVAEPAPPQPEQPAEPAPETPPAEQPAAETAPQPEQPTEPAPEPAQAEQPAAEPAPQPEQPTEPAPDPAPAEQPAAEPAPPQPAPEQPASEETKTASESRSQTAETEV